MKNRWMVIGFAALTVAVQAEVDFSGPLYKAGDTFEGTVRLLPESDQMIGRFMQGASAEIKEGLLVIKSGADANTTSAWLRDIKPVDLTGGFFRMVEFKVDKPGDGAGLVFALVDEDEGAGGSVNIVSYRENLLLGLNVNYVGENLALFIRRSGVDKYEGFSSGKWQPAHAAAARLELGTLYRAELGYDPGADRVTYKLSAVTSGEEICSGGYPRSEMSSDLAGHASCRFIAGEPFSNSSKGWGFSIRSIK